MADSMMSYEAIQASIAKFEAPRAPFDHLVRVVAALPDCDVEVTMTCADGVERRITRTKAPHG